MQRLCRPGPYIVSSTHVSSTTFHRNTFHRHTFRRHCYVSSKLVRELRRFVDKIFSLAIWIELDYWIRLARWKFRQMLSVGRGKLGFQKDRATRGNPSLSPREKDAVGTFRRACITGARVDICRPPVYAASRRQTRRLITKGR